MMIRTFVILCLVAAPAFGFWEKGFKVKYGADASKAGISALFDMPIYHKDATEAGWVEMEKPQVPTGYESLVLMCRGNFNDYCLFFDESGYIAGTQMCFNMAYFSDNVFDWVQSGFTKWSVTVDNSTSEFQCVRQYFASPEFLALKKVTGLATRNEDFILQDDFIYLEDFDYKLRKVSTSSSVIANSGEYTNTACYDGMGDHLVYNMSSSIECAYDALSRWYLLIHEEQFIGTGLYWPGKYTVDSDAIDIFEYPDRAYLEMLVPEAPECYYAMGDTGTIVLHTYFIENPLPITCS